MKIALALAGKAQEAMKNGGIGRAERLMGRALLRHPVKALQVAVGAPDGDAAEGEFLAQLLPLFLDGQITHAHFAHGAVGK